GIFCFDDYTNMRRDCQSFAENSAPGQSRGIPCARTAPCGILIGKKPAPGSNAKEMRIMDVKARALAKHYEWAGKLEITPRCPVTNSEELSLAYTPGVAEPCLAIR